jgi:hypothetical protein
MKSSVIWLLAILVPALSQPVFAQSTRLVGTGIFDGTKLAGKKVSLINGVPASTAWSESNDKSLVLVVTNSGTNDMMCGSSGFNSSIQIYPRNSTAFFVQLGANSYFDCSGPTTGSWSLYLLE